MTRTMRHSLAGFHISASIVILLWGAAPGAASAQDSATPTVTANSDLDEIVVTAERRAGKITTTPIAITALDSTQLASAGIQNLTEMTQVVPGLRMDQLGAHSQPTIRGISSAVAGPGSSANVATYIDGFYQPTENSTAFDLPDVSNVQVLKGPQGTLFGRNATGGAILVSTLEPSFKPTGEATVGYGSYNEKIANAYVSGGLTDALAASVTASYHAMDGWVHNIVTDTRNGGYDNYFVKLKLLWNATDKINFDIQFRHSENNDVAPIIYRADSPQSLGYFIPGVVITSNHYETASPLRPVDLTIDNGMYLTGHFDLGFAKLTSLSGYTSENSKQAVDLDASTAEISDLQFNENTRTFTQELTLASSGPVLDWSTGLYYFYNDGKLPYLYADSEGTPNQPNFTDDTTRTSAYAAFADGTWHFAPGWRLTGGVRYSTETQDFVYSVPAVSPDETRASHTWASTTPRAVISYDLTQTSSAYISFSKGFKSGTFNSFTPSSMPVNPETINAYEVGYKIGTKTLSLNTSAFYYDYKNLQVTSYVSTTGLSVATLQNAADAEIYGGDADLRWRVTNAFTLHGGVAYTHGRYTNFPAAEGLAPVAAGGFTNIALNASGNQMIRTPEVSGNVGFDYERPLGAGSLDFGSNLFFTSSFYVDAPNQYRNPGYALLDLSLRWTSASGRYSVAAIGQNVTNKYYSNYVDPVGAAIMVNDGRPATGRVIATVRY